MVMIFLQFSAICFDVILCASVLVVLLKYAS